MYPTDVPDHEQDDQDALLQQAVEAALDEDLHHTQRPQPKAKRVRDDLNGAKNVHLPETFDAELNRPRCTARNRSGYRCQRYPLQGATVCAKHGGAAPQVRRKAALRLAALVDPAIVTIARIMTDTSVRPGDRLRAANSVLDRAGIVRQTDMDTGTAQALLVQRLLDMRDEAARAAKRQAPTALVDPRFAHEEPAALTAGQQALWDEGDEDD